MPFRFAEMNQIKMSWQAHRGRLIKAWRQSPGFRFHAPSPNNQLIGKNKPTRAINYRSAFECVLTLTCSVVTRREKITLKSGAPVSNKLAVNRNRIAINRQKSISAYRSVQAADCFVVGAREPRRKINFIISLCPIWAAPAMAVRSRLRSSTL